MQNHVSAKYQPLPAVSSPIACAPTNQERARDRNFRHFLESDPVCSRRGDDEGYERLDRSISIAAKPS
jgi:hypothetical protein